MPKVSNWPCGSYPIYINPTWDELVEFTKSGPYNLRIMEYEEDLAICSGLSNTYNSVNHAYRKWKRIKRSYATDFILYKEHQTWFFNRMGHVGNFGEDQRFPTDEALQYFNESSQRILKDLLQLLKEPVLDESLVP